HGFAPPQLLCQFYPADLQHKSTCGIGGNYVIRTPALGRIEIYNEKKYFFLFNSRNRFFF
ncbi:MAG: hypothetical protein II413_14120, partial [Treponema sp.]|nr:hypothetical protein [Treponema sp.]